MFKSKLLYLVLLFLLLFLHFFSHHLQGQNCEIPINACISFPCTNGGTCHIQPGVGDHFRYEHDLLSYVLENGRVVLSVKAVTVSVIAKGL